MERRGKYSKAHMQALRVAYNLKFLLCLGTGGRKKKYEKKLGRKNYLWKSTRFAKEQVIPLPGKKP